MNCDNMKPKAHEILVFDDPPALARGFADWFYNFVIDKRVVTIALSGGSTPKLFFEILSTQYGKKIDWSKIHLFWGDERCVPPDHKESNFHMTRQNLLDRVAIPSQNIHRIYGESLPEDEADRYSDEIKDALSQNNNLPVFDLVILGLGADGHTASIFPTQMHLLKSDHICEVATHPESGQQRITLTGPVINNSKNICFLVTGKGKSDVVKDILKNTGDWQKYPAAHVHPNAAGPGSLRWFLDRDAARETEHLAS